MLRIMGLFSVALLLFAGGGAAQENPSSDGGGHDQLAQEIDSILKRTRTPGVAVAMFEPDGSVWRYTSGLKNLERQQPVDRSTVFRVGSVSKILVSLAVMKLVAEDRLSLENRVADLVPDVQFNNPWEKSHPLRVIHLLNHTTGWDAPHPPELVAHGKEPASIAEVLAWHPHSRQSRWAPGTRTAYNNTGPLVAAYIVEKVSGRRYEDFIQREFFEPLGMGSSGYYFDDDYRSAATDLYRGDEALPYWHLPNRAAGGLHSNLDDLVQFVRFMQQPDQLDQGRILDADYVRAMERPAGSYAATAGSEVGWGAGITSFHQDGLVFYGHEGSLPGAQALVAYQPEHSAGHIVLTNSNGPALQRIHQLLASYAANREGAHMPVHSNKRGQPDPSIAGYYRTISPGSHRFRIASSLLPWKITVADQDVVIAPLLGGKPRNLTVSDKGEYLQSGSGRTVLVKGEDPIAGSVLHYGPMTLQKTSGFAAVVPVLLLVTWSASALLGVFYLLFWLPRQLMRRSLSVEESRLRGWSVLPLSGLAVVLLGVWQIRAAASPYTLSASVSLPSLLVFSGSILFVLASLWAVEECRRAIRIGVRGFWSKHAILLTALNVAISILLLSYGLVGVRLWA